MTSIATIIKHWSYGRRPSAFLSLFLVALLMPVGVASAQEAQTEGTAKNSPDTIPAEAKAVFFKYVQQKDTATMAFMEKHRRDKFIKRFSFHTNAVDWATLVPNIGIEFDLKGTPRNNYSISLFGKFNGSSKHGKLVYNVNAIRVEGRKYWRTGKYGKANNYYDDFEKLYTDKSSPYFNVDTFAGRSYYVDTLGRVAKAKGVRMESLRVTAEMTPAQKDSLDFAEDSLGIRESRFRKWYYNTYHKFRRNVTSGRTLENARNWRAYYLGLWAGVDNWSISLTGKGKQGQGIGAGVVGGYTLPLLPQKFPREGSLDLDLGLAVGWKAVKYDAYTYEAQTQHYVYDPARSHPSWKVVPYPIVQDIHVSLVWRFRGIKSKVDRSLIDDYQEKSVERYKQRINDAEAKNYQIQGRREEILTLLGERVNFMADSTSVYDAFNKRRLEAAMRINPDTVFEGKDMMLYLKIFKGLKSQTERDKYLKDKKEAAEREVKAKAEQAKKDAKESAKQAKIAARELADSLETASRDSARQARIAARELEDSLKTLRKDSVRMARKHKVSKDTIQKDSLLQVDSVQVSPVDTIVALPEVLAPSLPVDTIPTETEDSIPVIVPQTDVPENTEEGDTDAPEEEDEGKDSDESNTEGEKSDTDAIACVLWRKWDSIA